MGKVERRGRRGSFGSNVKTQKINLKEKEKNPSRGLKTSVVVLFCFVLASECIAWQWV